MLAGLAMPPLIGLHTPELEDAHSFCRSSSWLIPGYVLLGSYPGSSPGRPTSNACTRARETGVSTFVCLQDELPPQTEAWPEEGVPNLSERVKWAEGNFHSYRDAAGPNASFLHFGLPDLPQAGELAGRPRRDRECAAPPDRERGEALHPLLGRARPDRPGGGETGPVFM